MSNEVDDHLDDENDGLHDNCPACGREYDEIDHEFQACHWCHWEAKHWEEVTRKEEGTINTQKP